LPVGLPGRIDQFRIPEFTAWPVTSLDDATVFVHDRPDPASPVGPEDQQTDFERLRHFLLGAETPDLSGTLVSGTGAGVPWPAAGPPRLSAAGEAAVWRATDPRSPPAPQAARGLVCFADRRRTISATLRSTARAGGRAGAPADSAPIRPDGFRDPWVRSNFAPSGDRAPGGRPCWFSLREQCQELFAAIFDDPPGGPRIPAHGLLVLTGATNSAKTRIAQGLIDLYLNRLLAADPGRKRRRPHLVTFEDPIETYYVGPVKPKALAVPTRLPRAVGDRRVGSGSRARQNQVHHWLRGLPPVLLAQWRGVDYTPREKGKDVRDLGQAFADALRQTPTVFFVGEVRDRREWAEVLEFAGTGHLVVTTAHAGSLLEAMIKILSAVEAETPADRRRYAARLLAVAHLRARPARDGAAAQTAAGRALLLPAVWRNTEPGLATLSDNGYRSIVAETDPRASSLGRRWFADRLVARASGGAAPPARPGALARAWALAGPTRGAAAEAVAAALATEATRSDLQGE
jgi:hypothetical protein